MILEVQLYPILHVTRWTWLTSAQKSLWQDRNWTHPFRFPCQSPHVSLALPCSLWAQSMHPAQGHNWPFTTVVVWRSLEQNNFLWTSLCAQSPCRTATLVHYRLLTNLEARCEMEKRASVVSAATHRSFLCCQSFEANTESLTPPTKYDNIDKFRFQRNQLYICKKRYFSLKNVRECNDEKKGI